MASAYAGFATLGRRVEPRFVLRVEAADGTVLWESRAAERTEMVRGDVAYILTDMLRDVVDRGTGTGVRRAGYHGPAAGKTGTTSDATDVWFIGYTPELVGTVWVGFDDVRPLPYRATGGGVAAPAWGRIMARMYRERPMPRWEDPPPNVLALRVDPRSGLALEDGCRPRGDAARREIFLRGTEPPTDCPRRAGDYYLDRLADWFGAVFGGYEEPARYRGATDPALGTQRLPRASDDADRGRGERRGRRGDMGRDGG
jgi:penicillin-binding protein 1A